MKLLLTSSGLSNQSIADALIDLVGKKAGDISVAFIPTASNVEAGDKDWFIDDLINLKKQNFKSIDIVDISAIDKKLWLPRLEEADVLFFEGGNTYHLMEWINKSGLADLLPELLKTRIYAGVSAGSMVTNKDLALEISQVVYGEDLDKTEDMDGLNFVDFYLLPHLNSEWFPKVRKETIEEAIRGMAEKVYALDDQSALKVVDDNVEIISEGKYLVFNE
jgi:dipeptidase E